MHLTKRLFLVCLFFACGTANAQIINTVAGNGEQGFSGDSSNANAARLYAPYCARPDKNGNIFIADYGNHRVRKVNGTSRMITTVVGTVGYTHAGDGGPATAASLTSPTAVAFDKKGNIYIAEDSFSIVANQYISWIRKVDTFGNITTIAGKGTPGYSGDNGPASAAGIMQISDIALDTNGNIYVADEENYRVRKIDTFGVITTVAGTGIGDYSGDGGPAASAQLASPIGLAVDTSGQVYIAGYYNVRKIDPSGIITTVVGTDTAGFQGDGGPATSAIAQPVGIAVDLAGNLYIADWHNYRVRKVNTLGIIFTICGLDTFGYSGDGGPAYAAALGFPRGIAVDPSGNIFIADVGDNVVRKISRYGDAVIDPQSQNETLAFKVWPDPNSGSFTLNISSAMTEPCQVMVTNIVGQKFLELNTTTNKQTEIKLNAPPGMYFVTTLTEHSRQSGKIIVH